MSEPAQVTEKLTQIEKIEHKNIYQALSAFQGELKPMTKSGTVEFQTKAGNTLKFNYTPLGEIMATIYPLLAKHGLSVRHEITPGGVEAILTHETYETGVPQKTETLRKMTDGTAELIERTYEKEVLGEIRSGVVKINYGTEMKDTGSAITYARRYTLTMVLGISSEDDKDAELLEQSAKNAVQTVYGRYEKALRDAKTVAEVEKAMGVLQKDLKTIEAGKAPALGLSKAQYQELLKIGESHIDDLNSNQDTK